MKRQPILSKAKRRALYLRVATRIKRSKDFKYMNLWVCYQLAELSKNVIWNKNSMSEIQNQFPEFGDFLHTDNEYPLYVNSIAFCDYNFETTTDANTARIDALLLSAEMCR